MKLENKFLVGSKYFFKNYPDFKSKDEDWLIIEYSSKDYKTKMHINGKGLCIFKWKLLPPSKYVELLLEGDLPMEIGKFLVPEVCEFIHFRIQHLKKLYPVIKKLDEKHSYQRIIFDSYIENNKFELTEEQRLKAYEEYKRTRNL